jgi:hypothetical protein
MDRSRIQHLVVVGKYASLPLHPHRPVLYAGDMARSNGDIDHSNGDIPHGVSPLTVPEAARALGISPEAVRNRLSRGTLNSEKENGTVYVLLPADRVRCTDDRSRYTADIPDGTSRRIGDTSNDILRDSASLMSAKDETIRVLSEQLEAERTASAELRRIVAGLVQRVPELEAAPEPRNAPKTASEGTVKGDVPPPEPERVSWLRRLLRA